MALGMGAPLIVVGVLARSALPKPGPWMEGVRAPSG
jgi:thiol:disulfide interchange protein DsbD